VPQYSGFKNAVSKIYELEGFRGMFKGLGISMVAQTAGKSSFFGM
jgi:hypothetical protein